MTPVTSGTERGRTSGTRSRRSSRRATGSRSARSLGTRRRAGGRGAESARPRRVSAGRPCRRAAPARPARDRYARAVRRAVTGGPSQRGDILAAAVRQAAAVGSRLHRALRHAGRLGLELPVHALGALYDESALACVYAACDVLAFPTRQDNLPNTLAEAIVWYAGGRQRCRRRRRSVRDGETGRLVPGEDAAAFASALVSLMDSILHDADPGARDAATTLAPPSMLRRSPRESPPSTTECSHEAPPRPLHPSRRPAHRPGHRATALLFKQRAAIGFRRLPLCREALIRVGVLPSVDHYYEPAFDHRTPARPFDEDRSLPGVHFDADAQLA